MAPPWSPAAFHACHVVAPVVVPWSPLVAWQLARPLCRLPRRARHFRWACDAVAPLDSTRRRGLTLRERCGRHYVPSRAPLVACFTPPLLLLPPPPTPVMLLALPLLQTHAVLPSPAEISFFFCGCTISIFSLVLADWSEVSSRTECVPPGGGGGVSGARRAGPTAATSSARVLCCSTRAHRCASTVSRLDTLPGTHETGALIHIHTATDTPPAEQRLPSLPGGENLSVSHYPPLTSSQGQLVRSGHCHSSRGTTPSQRDPDQTLSLQPGPQGDKGTGWCHDIAERTQPAPQLSDLTGGARAGVPVAVACCFAPGGRPRPADGPSRATPPPRAR